MSAGGRGLNTTGSCHNKTRHSDAHLASDACWGYADADYGAHRCAHAANSTPYADTDTKRAAGIDSFPAAHADTNAAAARIANIYSGAHP